MKRVTSIKLVLSERHYSLQISALNTLLFSLVYIHFYLMTKVVVALYFLAFCANLTNGHIAFSVIICTLCPLYSWHLFSKGQ